MTDQPDPKAEIGLELFKTDFEGLYKAHLRAAEDFSSGRFRTLLAVEAVPLLALGALLSAGAKEGATSWNLDVFALPPALYLVFLATSLLGGVVLEMWIRSSFLSNTYARALNRFRGKYLECLKTLAEFEKWDPWVPVTPKAPDWRTGGAYLSVLYAVLAGINFFYFFLAITGLSRLPQCVTTTRKYWLVSILSVVGALVAYFLLKGRLEEDQAATEKRLEVANGHEQR